MADDVITETDGPEGGPQGGSPVVELPSPLRPQSSGPIRTGANAPPPADEQYEIIEVDNEGKEIGGPQPVGQPAAPAAAAKPGALPADSELEFVPRPEFGEDGQPTRSRSKRQIRKEGRERTFAENAALRAELARSQDEIANLRQTVDTIAPRVVELGESEIRNRLSTMKTQLADVDRRFEAAEEAYFDAVQSGDRAAARTAGRTRDELMVQRYQLNEATRQIDEKLAANGRGGRDQNLAADGRAAQGDGQRQPQQQPQRQQRQPMPLTSAAETLRADFIQNDVPWLNVASPQNAFDARILAQIDDQIAAEGYDPSSNDYWDELAARGAKYLPHRFGAEAGASEAPAAQPAPARRAAAPAQPAVQRRGPATAAPAGPTVAPAKNQVRIDPQRKDALIQAGVLAPDGTVLDGKKFNRQIKAFAEYDRANGAGR